MNQSVSTLTGKIKIKIVFLGNQAVGKSSVIEKYVNNRFQQSPHLTVGIDFLAKNIVHKNKNLRLQLWDTAGQQRFKSLIPSYLRDAQCALILFDVTDKATFENIQNWLQMYNQNKTGVGFTLLIGNKIDLERDRQVSVEQASQKATQLGIPYFQISAKTGQHIQILFSNLLDICSQNSIDTAKFNIQKLNETPKIEKVQQKNQQEKQKENKQNKAPNQQKAKQTNKAGQQNQSKTIRLQNRKQKSKTNKKNCC